MPKYPINTYVIVENNPLDAQRVISLMQKRYPQMECYGNIQTVPEAIQVISDHRPDLVFMDVQLDDGKTCFDILDNIPPDDVRLIFVTNSEKHAEQAFEYNSVAYIRKPINASKLISAIKKAEEVKFSPTQSMADARDVLVVADPMQHKVNIDHEGRIARIVLNDIIAFKGAGRQARYSYVYLQDHSLNLLQTPYRSKPLGHLVEFHDLPDVFFRTKSWLINLNRITEVDKAAAVVFFGRNQWLSISRKLLPDLYARLGI